MTNRKERLNEVYEYLHNNLGVHTKGGFADSIRYARAYISSALNGNEKYLTDSLFQNICEVYKGVFNIDYLLTGEGSLLMSPMEQHAEEKDSRPSDAGVIQAYDVAIAKAYQEALDAKSELVFDLRARLAEKDAKIASLEAQLKKLESERLPDQDSLTKITIPHIVKNPHPHPVESPE